MSQGPEDDAESYVDRYQREQVAVRVREYALLDRDRAAARQHRGGTDNTARNLAIGVGGCVLVSVLGVLALGVALLLTGMVR